LSRPRSLTTTWARTIVASPRCGQPCATGDDLAATNHDSDGPVAITIHAEAANCAAKAPSAWVSAQKPSLGRHEASFVA
jgi:hypothetical protein